MLSFPAIQSLYGAAPDFSEAAIRKKRQTWFLQTTKTPLDIHLAPTREPIVDDMDDDMILARFSTDISSSPEDKVPLSHEG